MARTSVIATTAASAAERQMEAGARRVIIFVRNVLARIQPRTMIVQID